MGAGEQTTHGRGIIAQARICIVLSRNVRNTCLTCNNLRRVPVYCPEIALALFVLSCNCQIRSVIGYWARYGSTEPGLFVVDRPVVQFDALN